jgi:hypothetical protein
MSIKLIIREVTVETVQKGKNRYQIAHVVNEFNGRAGTQKIMSFANPEVFKKVQTLKPGDEVIVEITKNDAGYNQWAKIELAGEAEVADKPADGGLKGKSPAYTSQYETREERQFRQLSIVRQSSLSNAIAILTPGAKTPLLVADVLKTAQELVDFVYDNSEEDLAEANSDFEDVPL